MERQSHDEHQAAETLRIVDVSVLDGEAPGFEVREHRLDAPPLAVVQGAQVARSFGAFRSYEACSGRGD